MNRCKTPGVCVLLLLCKLRKVNLLSPYIRMNLQVGQTAPAIFNATELSNNFRTVPRRVLKKQKGLIHKL